MKDKNPDNIVLLHYFGGDAGSWDWLLQEMGNSHDTIALNVPGFGGSKEPAAINMHAIALHILQQVKELNRKRITLIGHSMSGKLALLIAKLDNCNLIKRLILIAPSPPTFEKMSITDKSKMLDQHNKDRARNNVINGVYDSISTEKETYAIQSQFRVSEAMWNWWINNGMNNNILREVKQINQELHLIYSINDQAIPLEQMEKEVIAKLDFDSITRMEDCGHLIPLEKPVELSQIINRIMKDEEN